MEFFFKKERPTPDFLSEKSLCVLLPNFTQEWNSILLCKANRSKNAGSTKACTILCCTSATEYHLVLPSSSPVLLYAIPLIQRVCIPLGTALYTYRRFNAIVSQLWFWPFWFMCLKLWLQVIHVDPRQTMNWPIADNLEATNVTF